MFPLPEVVAGIHAYKGIVWIVEGRAGWEVADQRFLIAIVDRYATLPEACEGAIRVLGPLWDRREATYRFLKVEKIEEVRGRVYVFARLEKSSRSAADATAGVMLNGCAIDPWADAQRALDSSGHAAPDLLAFRLRHNADRRHFQVGRYVGLATVDERA